MQLAKSNKYNLFVVKLNKLFLPGLILLFTFCLLIFSKTNLSAVKSGIDIWVNSIVPSLFPFFVATELLLHTNIIYYFGILFRNIIKPLFNVNGQCSFALIMGLISGYPVGAKIVSEFRKQNICSKEECERLLSFTNNSGPLFILGSVGTAMFGNNQIGLLLFLTHILASITVGFLFRFWKFNTNINKTKSTSYKTYNKFVKTPMNFSNLGGILAESIGSATSTIFIIGGFIIVFSCINSILESCNFFNTITNILTPLFNNLHIDPSFISPICSGILEITGGIADISNLVLNQTSLIITAFLLGFGGISIFLQVWSIVSRTDLSIKPYIYGKVLHGLFAALYTFIFLQFFNIVL